MDESGRSYGNPTAHGGVILTRHSLEKGAIWENPRWVREEPGRDPQITELLRDWQAGDREALDRLLPVVYSALRAIASRHLSRERRDGTLATTALVHEAYVRLVDQRDVDWQNRAHFFAIAARVMRRIVVDAARRRKRVNRGSGEVPIQLDSAGELAGEGGLQMPDVLALDRALADLEAMDPDQGRLVELKFFGGMQEEAIADVVKIALRTVQREGSVARAWLYHGVEMS